MNDSCNRVAKTSDEGTLLVPYSGIDETESKDWRMLFIYESAQHRGLRAVLRAKPAIRERAGGGRELTFEYELSGNDKSGSPSHGGIGLGTDCEIQHEWVAHALANGLNPIMEILLRQPEVAEDFCVGSPAMASVVGAARLERDTPPAKDASENEHWRDSRL